MKVLHELNAIIDFRKINNILGRKKDDIDQLFQLIRKGKIQTAAEVRAHFYPDSPHAERYANRLRQQLRQRMINTVFTSDIHEKDYWEQYFETAKKALVCEYLWNKGRSAAAAEIGAEVVREAEKFQFSHLGRDICRQLIGHYSIVQRNTRKYNSYSAKYSRFEAMDRWIREAELTYYRISLELRHLKVPKVYAIRQATHDLQKISDIPTELKSVQYVLVQANVAVLVFSLKNDLRATVATCEAALAYFEQLPFEPPARAYRSVYFNLVPAALQSEAYDKARQYIDRVKAIVAPGSHNWIGIHQYQTILAFRMQDLALAEASIAAIRESPHNNLIEEELRIYETYLDLLTGHTPKLGKFLNETIHYTTDKKGMNINILILQVLIFLSRGDRPAIIDRLEPLQAYAYRHLSHDPDTRRSELFFRLLFLLAKSAFDPVEVQRRSPELLDELRRTPRRIKAIDVEVVPYEWLWEVILGWL